MSKIVIMKHLILMTRIFLPILQLKVDVSEDVYYKNNRTNHISTREKRN